MTSSSLPSKPAVKKKTRSKRLVVKRDKPPRPQLGTRVERDGRCFLVEHHQEWSDVLMRGIQGLNPINLDVPPGILHLIAKREQSGIVRVSEMKDDGYTPLLVFPLNNLGLTRNLLALSGPDFESLIKLLYGEGIPTQTELILPLAASDFESHLKGTDCRYTRTTWRKFSPKVVSQPKTPDFWFGELQHLTSPLKETPLTKWATTNKSRWDYLILAGIHAEALVLEFEGKPLGLILYFQETDQLRLVEVWSLPGFKKFDPITLMILFLMQTAYEKQCKSLSLGTPDVAGEYKRDILRAVSSEIPMLAEAPQ